MQALAALSSRVVQIEQNDEVVYLFNNARVRKFNLKTKTYGTEDFYGK